MSDERNLWGLRILSLALAILIWFFVSVEKREPQSDRVVDANVTYKTAPGFVVLDPIQAIQVRIRGTQTQLRSVNPFLVDAQVELPAAQVGPREVVLGSEHLSLPSGIEVVSIEPNVLRLELDREISDLLPVEPRLEGEPAAGAIARTPEAIPSEVLVRGPESRLRSVGALSTTPVDLTGHALDFEERAAVVSPDSLIKVVDPLLVTVRVPMELPPSPSG